MRVVHMTSVHNALDHRIFTKECRSLARAGFTVTVVGPHTKDLVCDQVRIKSVPKYRSRLARMLRTTWSVYREAVRLNADVYHFHDPELIPLALLMRMKGRQVIYDVHEDLPRDIFHKPYLPLWSCKAIGGLAEWIEGLAGRHFSAIVAVTPAIAARFARINRRTVTLFNFPYSEDLSEAMPVSWHTRRQSVAYIGTITPQRGIAEMVRAIGLLPDSIAPQLEIAGDVIPPEVMKLPGWPRVKFYGVLGQRAAYELLGQVRVGVVCEHPIPTFVDAIPVKLFEYMGAGLPVIASNFPFWRKLLEGIDCAIFVDPKNVAEIASAIEYLLTHPEEAERMGRQGQAAVASRFNWNTEAQKLVDLYLDVVRRPCVA